MWSSTRSIMNLSISTGVPYATPKTNSKQAEQITMLKHEMDHGPFSWLYTVMKHRKGDMANFFKHENHPYPHSLSDGERYD